MDKYDDYESKVLDIDEVAGTDIKINPDFYIHNALLKAQSALINDDAKTGFTQFRVLVENIEILCNAAKMLPLDYEEQLKDYKKSRDFKEETDVLIQGVKLANQKLKILMSQVFSAKTATQPLKA